MDKSNYFSKEFMKTLQQLFNQGVKVVDISVKPDGLVIVSPKR